MNFDLKETMGDRIHNLRRKKHMTQAHLAKIVGVTRQIISDYERGKIDPSWRVMVKMAETMGVSLDYFAKGNSNEV